MKASLGFDFGTESVRAALVDLRGRELATAVAKYSHEQIIESLPGSRKKLPPLYALQHPLDWIESAAKAILANGVMFAVCFIAAKCLPATPRDLSRLTLWDRDNTPNQDAS